MKRGKLKIRAASLEKNNRYLEQTFEISKFSQHVMNIITQLFITSDFALRIFVKFDKENLEKSSSKKNNPSIYFDSKVVDANRRPINVSLSLRITRSRPVEAGICTCTKRDDRRVRLIRNKSISRPVDCRPNDSTAIQLTVSSWLSNNARSFERRRIPTGSTYTTR